MNAYKPENYNSVSPYLIVDDAQRMIDMLIEIFGAVPLRRYNTEDGDIMHAEVMLDDSVIMISQSTAEYPQNKSLLHVYVAKVEQVFERGIIYGCKEISKPVTNEGDPDKRGMFEDFAGNIWAVSTQHT